MRVPQWATWRGRRLRRLESRLKKVDRNVAVNHLDVSAVEAKVDSLIKVRGSGPEPEDVICFFEEYLDSCVAEWKSTNLQRFRPLFTELDVLETEAKALISAYKPLVEDAKSNLSSAKHAVTAGMYTLADDDQPRQNPLRSDPLHANPPLADPGEGQPSGGDHARDTSSSHRDGSGSGTPQYPMWGA